MSHFYGIVERSSPLTVTFPIGSPPVSGEAPASTISRNGAAFVPTTNAPVEIPGTGYYALALTATDLNFEGTAVIRVLSTQPAETLIVQVRSIVNVEMLGQMKSQQSQNQQPILNAINQSMESVSSVIKNQIAVTRAEQRKLSSAPGRTQNV